MTDTMTNHLPSGFFSGWVILLFVLGLAFLAFLLLSSHYSKNSEHKNLVWDKDLSETDQVLPAWWFLMFACTIIFSAIYVILYPGLGNFPGIKNWTSGGHHSYQQAELLASTKYLRDEFSEFNLEELQDDSRAMKSAASLYRNNCAACHGNNAEGIAGFAPNLNDDDWIWGSDEQAVRTSISEGRNNIMPGWEAVIGAQGVEQVTDYVLSLSKNKPDQESAGATIYQQNCAACHGESGDGNQLLGAPRLNDSIWLFGSSRPEVYDIIAHGVINDGTRWTQSIMPAQKHRLSELEISLLTAWVLRQ